MENVSKLLKLLEEEIKLNFGSENSGLKVMYGYYLSEGDSPEILGESLNILTSGDKGLMRVGRVCLSYFPKIVQNYKIELYETSGDRAEIVKNVSEKFLESHGIKFMLWSEHV